MLYKLPYMLAIKLMLIILSSVVVFHVLVLIQIIPYTIVWAGKINSLDDMRIFELVSIIINVLMICVIAIKGNYIKWKISMKLITVLLWLFVVLFGFNTIGNLLSKTNFETVVFTPLTLIVAVLCFRIVMEKNNQLSQPVSL